MPSSDPTFVGTGWMQMPSIARMTNYRVNTTLRWWPELDSLLKPAAVLDAVQALWWLVAEHAAMDKTTVYKPIVDQCHIRALVVPPDLPYRDKAICTIWGDVWLDDGPYSLTVTEESDFQQTLNTFWAYVKGVRTIRDSWADVREDRDNGLMYPDEVDAVVRNTEGKALHTTTSRAEFVRAFERHLDEKFHDEEVGLVIDRYEDDDPARDFDDAIDFPGNALGRGVVSDDEGYLEWKLEHDD